MEKIIAIPIENGSLCAHFGHCEKFAIITFHNGSVTSKEEIVPPAHEPGLYPAWIAGKGVTDVIAGGMGQKAITLFNSHKINVFTGAEMKDPLELAEDFMNDRLEVSANYCDH
jgi:predicted Fe-Mo cluster-binding NifX family protein